MAKKNQKTRKKSPKLEISSQNTPPEKTEPTPFNILELREMYFRRKMEDEEEWDTQLRREYART
jgi:hypothetical protein